MSDFDSNPFADPNANPFADPSVRQAINTSQDRAALEDVNPFASDQFVPEKQTVGTTMPAQPAVLHTSYELPPPSYSATAAPQSNQALADSLQSRQEELERKAADLDRREKAMQREVNASVRVNNFPPLPRRFPIKPCFYQDISLEIPAQFQTLVKFNFYLWIAYSCLLFVNVCMSIAFFAVSMSTPDLSNNQSGMTFGLSILYFMLWTPSSFVCWFRPVYNAFRSDSSFFFFVYFGIFFLQFCANVVQSLGIPGSGTVGWLSGFATIASGGTASAKAMGICMLVVGLLFSLMAGVCLLLLFKVHRIYRSSGASFSKAQAEFAQGIVTNRTVQTAAAGVAASAARGAMDQQFSNNSGNNY